MLDERSGRFEHLSRYIVTLEFAGFEEQHRFAAPSEVPPAAPSSCGRCASSRMVRRRFVKGERAITISACLDCGFFEPVKQAGEELP